MLKYVDGHEAWMRLVCELGAVSGERGAGKKKAGSRDCRKKSKNRKFSSKIEFFIDVNFKNYNLRV
jgi:hypothetical protein